MQGRAKTRGELLAEIEVLQARLAEAREALADRREELPKDVVEERGQVEETLRRYELLAGHSRDIILFMRSDDGRILEANAAAVSAYGYSRRELLTLTIRDLRCVETHGLIAGQMAVADDRGILFESVHRRKDGSTFPVEVSSRGAAIGGTRTVISVIRDISERKKAEEALRDSEERYRTLFTNMTEGFALGEALRDENGVPRDFRFLEVNDAFERQSGLRRDIVGRPMTQVLPHLERNWIDTYCGVALTGEPVRFRNYNQDTNRHYEVFCYRPAEGRFAILFRDVTKEMEAEQTLRESREDLNRAQAVAHTGSWRLDVRRNELLWSDENHRIFGIPQGTPLTYEAFLSIVHPEDRDYVDQRWTAALRGEHYDIEHRIVVGDTVRWVREKAELEFDGQGSLRGGFGTTQDITELKQAQQALHRRSALLQGINRMFRESILCETEAEVAKTCLIVAEKLTGSTLGFIGEVGDNGLFSELAQSAVGWDACRVPESEAALLVHDMEIRGIWGRVLRDEKALIVNDPSSHPDSTGVPEGHPRITAFMGVPLKKGDATFGMIALANKENGYDHFDVEAVESLAVAFVEALSRKRAQEMLRRAHDELEVRVEERTRDLRVYMAKLEQSNRELEEFAFVASHDLQAPLRKIRMFADLLGSMEHGSLGDKERDYLGRMRGAAERMQDLILDLLKYSRVTRNPESFELVDLSDSVREAVLDLRPLFEETDGVIEIGELPRLEADKVQMRQLFQNLIGNGLKYRDELRPVVKVYSDPQCRHGYRKIHVEDNGIGFEERFVEKIFKPFQRLHGDNSPYPGTGMGLAICRKIVERHGGSITAASEPGKGTVFTVSLPEKQPAPDTTLPGG